MRRELLARPGVALFAAVALGVAFAHGFLPALAAVGVLLAFLGPRAAWIGAGFLMGWLLGPPPPAPPGRTWLAGSGHAVSVAMPEPFGGGWRYEAIGPDGRRWLVRNGAEAALGEGLSIRGVGRPLTGRTADLARRRGIAGAIAGRDVDLRGGESRWAALARDARRSYRASLRALLAPRDAAFVQALGANLTTDLDEEQREVLRTTGSIHLVSASGFHAGVLLQAAMLLLGFLPVRRGWQIGAGVAVLAFYATAVGLQAPIVRAGLMAVLGLCGPLLRREPDPLSAWGWSGALWLVFRPGDLFDLGFQLSYVTLAALILGGWNASGPSWIARSGLWAVIGSAPLVAYHFRGLPLYGIPANLLVEAAVPPILFFSVIGWGLGGVAPIGWLCGGAMTLFSRGIQSILAAIATLPGARVEIAPFSPWLLALFYLGLLLLWTPRRRPVP